MWIQNSGSLVRTFEFTDFFKAVTFIDKISLLCDNLQHMPQWQHSQHRVRVSLAVEKEGRTKSVEVLQQEIEDIYAHI
jgi:pterin-4a-carbinolamine dehydratase